MQLPEILLVAGLACFVLGVMAKFSNSEKDRKKDDDPLGIRKK
jgi:hypothetical protein